MDGSSCTVTLWHASGVEVPAKLIAALTNAKMRVNRVGDPFLALAQLCMAQKRGDPAAPRPAAKLVILYPEMLTDLAEFCAAADIYAPGVPRWQYGPATNPELRAIVDSDVTKWSPNSPEPAVVIKTEVVRAAERTIRAAAPHHPTSRTMPGSPQLRLAGEGPSLPPLDNPSESADVQELAGQGAGQGSGDDARSGASGSHLITDEELRMLLGESTEDKPETR